MDIGYMGGLNYVDDLANPGGGAPITQTLVLVSNGATLHHRGMRGRFTQTTRGKPLHGQLML